MSIQRSSSKRTPPQGSGPGDTKDIQQTTKAPQPQDTTGVSSGEKRGETQPDATEDGFSGVGENQYKAPASGQTSGSEDGKQGLQRAPKMQVDESVPREQLPRKMLSPKEQEALKTLLSKKTGTDVVQPEGH